MNLLSFPDRILCGDWRAGALFGKEPLEECKDEIITKETAPGSAKYRYALWRTWNLDLPIAVWCMLNPSTATHTKDDATIRKVRGFSARFGYGSFLVVNLFALRSRYPLGLIETPGPTGPLNSDTIQRVIERLQPTKLYCAWGSPGGGELGKLVRWRAEAFPHLVTSVARAPQLMSLKVTKTGHPWHPVMLGYGSTPQPWSYPAEERSILI